MKSVVALVNLTECGIVIANIIAMKKLFNLMAAYPPAIQLSGAEETCFIVVREQHNVMSLRRRRLYGGVDACYFMKVLRRIIGPCRVPPRLRSCVRRDPSKLTVDR